MSGSINCTCTLVDENTVICNGTEYKTVEEVLTYENKWFWIYIGIYVILVLFAGMMSGLTLGLLSLDTLSLDVLREAGTVSQQKNARRILPLVKRHHLLLVTLLLANAAAVESMPLCLDRVSNPIIAIIVSVTAVLLFGEVFPQALCSRFGLAIGAVFSPMVYVLIVLLFPISFPLAKLLDCLLGKNHATFFRRAELKALVGLHGPNGLQTSQDNIDSPLSYDEVLIIKGALEMRDKVVRDAMVPLESIFMLETSARMDRPTIRLIMRDAHSRIPIYADRRSNIRGMLLVKRLLALDPAVATPVTTLMEDPRCFRPVSHACDNMPLYDLLNEFQKGKSHLAVVRRMPYNIPTGDGKTQLTKQLLSVQSTPGEPEGETVGIITLEDVIEELLQEEIVDETDVFVDVHRRVRVARARALRMVSRDCTDMSRSDSQSTLYSHASSRPPFTYYHPASTRSGGSHPPDLLNVPEASDTTPLLTDASTT